MRDAERSRGVILRVLDLSALEAKALELRKETHPDCYEAKIYGGKIGLAEAKSSFNLDERHRRAGGNGQLYTVCTEGVGPEMGVTFDDPLLIEFHGSYGNKEQDVDAGETASFSFDFLPFASTTLNPDELRSYPVLEEVDLADFIRSFGARLENNFWNWYNVLS